VSTPLISIIRQHYISAASHGIINESSSAIVKNYGVDVKATGANPEATAVSQTQFEGKVGFVGLGSMGYGMASSTSSRARVNRRQMEFLITARGAVLHQANFDVTGFDVWQPSVERFAASGASTASTANGACAGAKVVVLMVVSAAQAEEVLFEGGVADGKCDHDAAPSAPQSTLMHHISLSIPAAMAQEGVVLLMSTVPPSAAISMQNKLREVRPDLYLLDCPVSGGVGRAAQGDLTILCGGADKGIDIASPVLKALSGTLGKDANLCIIPGGLGKGSAVKMVHQALAGELPVR
jgi:3-hydroxyisobutyrate dehydrogenase-like beta-hydroxyacid dehydrogenase